MPSGVCLPDIGPFPEFWARNHRGIPLECLFIHFNGDMEDGVECAREGCRYISHMANFVPVAKPERLRDMLCEWPSGRAVAVEDELSFLMGRMLALA